MAQTFLLEAFTAVCCARLFSRATHIVTPLCVVTCGIKSLFCAPNIIFYLQMSASLTSMLIY